MFKFSACTFCYHSSKVLCDGGDLTECYPYLCFNLLQISHKFCILVESVDAGKMRNLWNVWISAPAKPNALVFAYTVIVMSRNL